MARISVAAFGLLVVAVHLTVIFKCQSVAATWFQGIGSSRPILVALILAALSLVNTAGLLCAAFGMSTLKPLETYGPTLGLLVGLWANVQFLLAPYVGAYPSLPAVMIGSAVSGGTNAGPSYYITVLVANSAIWTVAGYVFSFLARPAQR
jgi:hypothetical protein